MYRLGTQAMTFKKCRNEGCEIMIEVRNTAEGWRPYEESGNKHNCQFSDYAKKQREQEKNDHGNESFPPTGAKKILELTPEGMELLKETEKGYIDHTAKGASKVAIFSNETKMDTQEAYIEFLRINNGKIKTQGAHDHVTKDDGDLIYTIYLYYEEIKQ